MKAAKYNLILISALLLSCKGFLEIEPPKTSLISLSAFHDNETATSAMLGIYAAMAGSGYAGGSATSISSLAGLSADELDNYNPTYQEFYDNQLSNINSTLRSLYLLPYQHIFATNAILEGLNAANTITPSVKAQLQGEAYFVRAFIYFYLTEIFGQIPLQLTTDYRISKYTTLSNPEQVYQQIITDLRTAESLLKDSYPTNERVRPNLSTAQALLARVYLYQEDWINAEKYASLVIGKTATYKLPAPEIAFLKESKEAIWQLFPSVGANTREGNLFILTTTPINVALNSDFVQNGFETGDKRKTAWIRNYTNSIGSWYYPFKYRVKSSSTITEYSIVLRLAEQYLIRAEARVQQNKLETAIDDLDKIRLRAALPLIKDTNPDINLTELLTIILKERKAELFSEWGHRWLDLKRVGKADAVLHPLKPDWQDSDEFYPLPADEINRNPNIN